MKTLNDVVVEKLCYYLGKEGWTQYKLASECGIPFSTIKSIMQKRTKGIELKTIILLAHGLKIKPSEFIDDDKFLAENLDLD
ncbi:MAG: helix-turn-helix transcriptional regulator [Clostridia bacterium]|nr:helix-turn-helix transcriptional regulator [Clostridia bacterium]